jgi:hypothetical protein
MIAGDKPMPFDPVKDFASKWMSMGETPRAERAIASPLAGEPPQGRGE